MNLGLRLGGVGAKVELPARREGSLNGKHSYMVHVCETNQPPPPSDKEGHYQPNITILAKFHT